MNTLFQKSSMKWILGLILLFSQLESKQYILITTLYNEVRPQRLAEYIETLHHNLVHPQIQKIHVYYDRSRDQQGENLLLSFLQSQPVDITYIDKRPSFAQIFDFVNSNYLNQEIIICNGDIYFDETLVYLDEIDLNHKLVALSKWDILPNGELESHPWYDHGVPSWGSQDAWIFSTPVTNFDQTGVEIGTAFCEGYIGYFAFLAGYRVFNPCLSVIAHHLHPSAIRDWILHPPTRLCLQVPWCTIDNIIFASKENLVRHYLPN